MFKFQFNTGVNYYKSVLTNTESNRLTNFYYSTQIEYFNKNFSFSFGWRKPTEVLSGEIVTRSENNSFINATYKNKNLLIGLAIYYPFSAGSEYKSTRNSDTYYNKREILIKDNSNMFVIGVVYTVNWGRSLFNIRRNLNNVEFNNPIMTKSD
jgi:predicted porin